jgi:hypothetical protein
VYISARIPIWKINEKSLESLRVANLKTHPHIEFIHPPSSKNWKEKEVDGSGRFFWASDVFGRFAFFAASAGEGKGNISKEQKEISMGIFCVYAPKQGRRAKKRTSFELLPRQKTKYGWESLF